MDSRTFNKRLFTLASIPIAFLLSILFYGMLTVSDQAFSSQPFSLSRFTIASFSTSCWVVMVWLSFKSAYDESVGKSDNVLLESS